MLFLIVALAVWCIYLSVEVVRLKNGLDATYRHLTTRGGNRD